MSFVFWGNGFEINPLPLDFGYCIFIIFHFREARTMTFSERSSLACHNGKLFEYTIQSLLTAYHPAEGKEIDGELFGSPAELKACQHSVYFSDRKSPKSGRFYLKGHQHSKLLECGGRYIFGVIDGEQVVKTRIILASKIFPEFEGCRTFTWTTVFRRVM
jgi:hypothetical protein